MKFPYFHLIASISSAFLLSQCASAEDRAVLHDSGYLEESPLPKGYPMPGPFGEITKKSYPTYRAAVTSTEGANRGFWTLFRHNPHFPFLIGAPRGILAEGEKANS